MVKADNLLHILQRLPPPKHRDQLLRVPIHVPAPTTYIHGATPAKVTESVIEFTAMEFCNGSRCWYEWTINL